MIIVTGGAGFIGSALVWGLNKLGREDIYIVDAFKEISDEKMRNLSNLKYKCCIDKDSFIEDICKTKKYKNAECIFHLGAITDTREDDKDALHLNNVEYPKHLLFFSLMYDIRFIYASSAATYGNGSYGFKDDEETIKKLNPFNKYGKSKQTFDLFVLHNKYINNVAGLKFFNVFGPNEYHKGNMSSFIYRAHDKVLKGDSLKLFKSNNENFKDGEQKRDFVYVKDIVDMLLFFLENNRINGIFNAGTGISTSWNTMAHLIFDTLNMPDKIEYIDFPNSMSMDYQDFTEADMSKLFNAGYGKKITPMKEAIEDYYLNYLNNMNSIYLR
jgi:ADP-L-glycero-D-manno-heptose 6-epimerase